MIQPEDDKNAAGKSGAILRRPRGLPGNAAPTRMNLQSPDYPARAEAERMLGRRLAPRLRGGNLCHVLCDATLAYPAMLEAIENARERILFEIYIFRDDRWGTRFFDALLGRALAGVKVYLMYDAFGAMEAEDLFVALRGAGAKIHEYNGFRFSKKLARLNRRNHRKILVVDGEIGFVGGLNVGNEYIEPGRDLPFRDTQLSVRGPMVGQLEDAFIDLWRHETGRHLQRSSRPRPAMGEGRGLVIAKTPLRGRYLLSALHRNMLKNAQSRIWIANAYFVPKRRLRKELFRAAQRGVDVRLMLPGPTDVPMVRWASRSQYTRLLQAGIRIFEYRARMLHMKTMLIDEHWLMVGSTNLDHRSFNWNLEVQAVVRDPDAARELEAHWQSDLEQCEEIHLDEWRNRSWWEKVLNRFAYLFHRWL